MLNPPCNVCECDRVEGIGEPNIQLCSCAWLAPPQKRFDLRPAVFAGREIRGVGRQPEHARFNGGRRPLHITGVRHLKMVEQHPSLRRQARHEQLRHQRRKSRGVHCPRQTQSGHPPAQPQRANDRHDRAMIAGHPARGALPPRRARAYRRVIARWVPASSTKRNRCRSKRATRLRNARRAASLRSVALRLFFSPQTPMLQRPIPRRDMDLGLGLCLQRGRQFHQRGGGALCHLPA